MSALTKPVYGPCKLTKLELMGIRFAIADPADPGAGDPAPKDDAPVVIATASNPKPAPPASATSPADPAGADPTPPADPAPGDGLPDDPSILKAKIAELNRENAARRVENREEQQRLIDAAKADAAAAAKKEAYEQLGKSLGLVPDGEETDPVKLLEKAVADRDALTAQLAAAALRDQDRKTADALTAAANTHEGDVALVNAVVKADDLLKDIDTNADDYAAQVAAVVKDAIEKNPKLRTVQVASRSGGDDTHTGDPIPGATSVDSFRKKYRQDRGFRD